MKKEIEKMMGVDEPKIEGSVGDRNEGGISVAIEKKNRYGGSNRGGLVWSGLNEGLSEREVYRVRKMVRENEICERANNIVIKGLPPGSAVNKTWAEGFIKEKLGIEINVIGCRMIGNVVIVRLENEEKKKEVMINIFKSRGESFFIENDLTWDEREVQKKIYKWVREKKDKGRNVKTGFARIMIERKWIKWEELEKKHLDYIWMEGIRIKVRMMR